MEDEDLRYKNASFLLIEWVNIITKLPPCIDYIIIAILLKLILKILVKPHFEFGRIQI